MASIHPQSCSMAGLRGLAAVPEGSTDGSAAASQPRGLYRDWIRTVALSGEQRRSTMTPTIFGHSGSSYSSASNSCPSNSNNSGYSYGSASAAALERFGYQELKRIAGRMVSDGYTGRMVEEFVDASSESALKFGGSPDHALKNWFSELDVDWVLQIDDEHGLRRLLRDKPATTQDLVYKWIRALTVIVASTTELVCASQTPAIPLFAKESITEMLDVVDVIITVLQGEKLQVVIDMFTCVCGVSHIFTPLVISPTLHSVLNSLEGQGNKLSEIVASTMEEVWKLVEEDDSWAIEISRGGGEVHKNTRFIMDCIVSMTNACNSVQLSRDNTKKIGGLIDDTVNYLKGLLLRKSELCSDPSLRYLFLLNNSYFLPYAMFSSPGSFIPELRHLTCIPPECKKYMDSYLDVSWGYVLSCIPKSRFPGPIHCWINTSSLAKFESAFHQMYQAQKLWKVPDPQLREALRRAIIERVISGYRHYLEEHPELKKHVGHERSSPEVLEEMLRELFEG